MKRKNEKIDYVDERTTNGIISHNRPPAPTPDSDNYRDQDNIPL